MSPCNLQVVSNITDLKSVHKFLFESSEKEELVQWDNDDFENNWEMNDDDQNNTDDLEEAMLESDEDWFQKCKVAISPLADFLCICYQENAVFLSNQ